MQVKELLLLLQAADPEAEVLLLDYIGEAYSGVEDTQVKDVLPACDDTELPEREPAFVLRMTHEVVAFEVP